MVHVCVCGRATGRIEGIGGGTGMGEAVPSTGMVMGEAVPTMGMGMGEEAVPTTGLGSKWDGGMLQ